MKYLEYYHEAMKTGKLPGKNGLCMDLDLPRTITPTTEDRHQLSNEGFCSAYWGAGLPAELFMQGDRLETEFTPLRQTIVLFLAAMNDEL